MNKLPKRIITAAIIIALSQFWPAGHAASAQSERVLVGAYDSVHPNGVVFITNDQNFFGLRFLLYRPGVAVADAPRSFDFGPHATDGSYAQLKWRSRFDDKIPAALRWSRVSDRVVVGRLTAPPNTRMAIEAYRPWANVRSDAGWTAFSAQDDHRTILGEQVSSQKTKPLLRNFLLGSDVISSGA